MSIVTPDAPSKLLKYEDIEIILNFLEENEFTMRDKVLVMFCIYLGLERSIIRSLNWEMFNTDRTTIMFENNRIIPIPRKLSEKLKQLEKENKSKGIKGKFLFYTKYNKKFNVIYETSINDIFDKLQKIDMNDSKWKSFSPQYIRNCLIEILFLNKFSIEEIVYLTGADLFSVSKIISYDELCKSVNSKKNLLIKKHPFNCFLE